MKANATLEMTKKDCDKGYLFGNGYEWYDIYDNKFYKHTETDVYEITDVDMRLIWAKERNKYIELQEDNERVNNPWAEAYQYIIENVDAVLKANIHQLTFFDYMQ